MRTPLVLVAGLAADAAQDVTEAFDDPRTAVVHHGLAQLDQGVVSRRIRYGSQDNTTRLELTHGCLSCVLREELLPLLRRLAVMAQVRRIVLHLDPALEPETVCWAMHRMPSDGHRLVEAVEVAAVLTVLDAANWLADATGGRSVQRRGYAAGAHDDRTLAQLAVGQVEFADAVIVAGAAPDIETAHRTDAVLDRLVPIAPRTRAAGLDPEVLLAAVPPGARRGRVDDAHAVLTRPEHPRHTEHGIGTVFFQARRPFHPARLHAALDVLLRGVVRARGRMWVASQPDEVLALESAGRGLRVARAGPWLAAVADWSAIPVERALMASLRWDDHFEDREQALMAVFHTADPEIIFAALNAALITDDEIAAGRNEWLRWPDPFAEPHTEPCSPAERTDAREGHLRHSRN